MAEDAMRKPWPPTPEEAPTPAQLLELLAGLVGSGTAEVPDPQDVLEAFADLVEQGSPEYRAADRPIAVLDELMERLDEEERALLRAYEDRVNERADAWASDRFRLGYALGAALGRIID